MHPPPPDADTLNEYAQLSKAPGHIVELILGLLHQRTRRHGPDTLTPSQRAATERSQAREFADRIWAEATHAGAAWGLARNTQPIRIITDKPPPYLLDLPEPAKPVNP